MGLYCADHRRVLWTPCPADSRRGPSPRCQRLTVPTGHLLPLRVSEPAAGEELQLLRIALVSGTRSFRGINGIRNEILALISRICWVLSPRRRVSEGGSSPTGRDPSTPVGLAGRSPVLLRVPDKRTPSDVLSACHPEVARLLTKHPLCGFSTSVEEFQGTHRPSLSQEGRAGGEFHTPPSVLLLLCWRESGIL